MTDREAIMRLAVIRQQQPWLSSRTDAASCLERLSMDRDDFSDHPL